ncbi:MAG TPA: hypothetical protein EYP22_08720 [Methanosarcinales archaeon]|nr:hypothetical protein [Methanosarcinales archaeon]
MSWKERFKKEVEQRKYLAKKYADWKEIEKLPPRPKKAVLDYINGEVVGIGGGASRAGLDKIGFIELLRKLKVPMTG